MSPGASATESGVACFSLDPQQPWNQPAPPEIHPKSKFYSSWLWQNGTDRPGNLNVSPGYAVYQSSAGEFEYIVRSTHGNMNGHTLPFSDKWTTFNADKQIIIIDDEPGFTYEFYNTTIDQSARIITATRGEYLHVDDNRIYGHGGNRRSRGIGIPYISMLVLDCEIKAGVIAHALSLRVGRPQCDEAWWPATKVENHPDCVADGMPEGARFIIRTTPKQVDAWAAGLRKKGGAPLEAFGRALAEALRTYGFFITDNGGGIAEFDVQSAETWADSNALKRFAIKEPDEIRDMLDGLIRQSDIHLVAEQGPRVFEPRD